MGKRYKVKKPEHYIMIYCGVWWKPSAIKDWLEKCDDMRSTEWWCPNNKEEGVSWQIKSAMYVKSHTIAK